MGFINKYFIILSSFQKLQPAVIYIVEGHEKARGFERKHSIYFQDGHRKCRNGMPEFKKGTAFLPSPFPERQKNQRKLKTTKRLRTPEIPYRAEMTGDSCLARAVAPRAAAAVDHADTELIGHDGKLETPGFFAVVLVNDSPPENVNCLRDGRKRGAFYFYTAPFCQILFLFCTI